MGEIRSRGHVAAQSSWAPKKPSATAVHDVKCCVFLCVYTGRRVPPVLYLDGNLDGTGRVRALCVPALFRLPPVSFNRNRAMEGRRDGLRGRAGGQGGSRGWSLGLDVRATGTLGGQATGTQERFDRIRAHLGAL